ncbi:MAG TPA: hypothetical protein VGB29_05575, partial [Thermodesulfobacteriota bacterium]
ADGSGGRPFYAQTSSELSALYLTIARQLINQYRVSLQSRKSLDNLWHRLRVELKIAKGKAQVEKLYLATLRPVLPTGALEAFRQGMNWLYLLAIILCAVVVALAAAIVVIAMKRSKKA